MDNLTQECDTILEELSLFSGQIITLGPPIADNRLEFFEQEIGFKLPGDLEYILKKHNGISLMGTGILGLGKQFRGSSLDEVYRYEHNEVYNRMPPQFLPFSPDGYGNHYCLNLTRIDDGLCPVVFWQHDIDYANLDEVEECNENLVSWIKEVMIEWTLNDYNYDGSEK